MQYVDVPNIDQYCDKIFLCLTLDIYFNYPHCFLKFLFAKNFDDLVSELLSWVGFQVLSIAFNAPNCKAYNKRQLCIWSLYLALKTLQTSQSIWRTLEYLIRVHVILLIFLQIESFHWHADCWAFKLILKVFSSATSCFANYMSCNTCCMVIRCCIVRFQQ